mgnify:CR=1 FL=1
MGESGSGKSTLAKLLIHYYDPQKGSISIGGQKLCDMSLEALNSRISYVAQDQYLFNTSLLENIRLGRLNATDEEVLEAGKKPMYGVPGETASGHSFYGGRCGKCVLRRPRRPASFSAGGLIGSGPQGKGAQGTASW